MNNNGQIVGTSGTPSGQAAFIWSPTTPIMSLGTTNLSSMQPVAINDTGLVVGSVLQPDRLTAHAFAWQAGLNQGQMVDLGTLGGTTSLAVAVNSKGIIAGYSTTATGQIHVFQVKVGSKMQDLGALSGGNAQAAAINSAGQITGFGELANGVGQHAFLSNGNHLVDLGTLGGGQNSQGIAVNDSGLAVGVSDVPSNDGVPFHAFVATLPGTMTDLGTLGGRNSQPSAINNQNQVCGSANNTAGETHAVLWTVP
jgi:probable HAF family extracellular repeat protein